MDDTDDLILISQDGDLIRMHANDIACSPAMAAACVMRRLADKVAVLAHGPRCLSETAKPEG